MNIQMMAYFEMPLEEATPDQNQYLAAETSMNLNCEKLSPTSKITESDDFNCAAVVPDW